MRYIARTLNISNRARRPRTVTRTQDWCRRNLYVLWTRRSSQSSTVVNDVQEAHHQYRTDVDRELSDDELHSRERRSSEDLVYSSSPASPAKARGLHDPTDKTFLSSTRHYPPLRRQTEQTNRKSPSCGMRRLMEEMQPT